MAEECGIWRCLYRVVCEAEADGAKSCDDETGILKRETWHDVATGANVNWRMSGGREEESEREGIHMR